jgi:hypothetical protein
MTTTTNTAGWYPDPEHPGLVRYWDGVTWTSDIRPESTAPAKRAARRMTDAEREAEAQRQAVIAYVQTPQGRAEQARARGQAFFEIELEMASLSGPGSTLGSSGARSRVRRNSRPDVLGQIEDVGWRLEHVGYVFVETGATTTNRVFQTGQGTVTRGVVMGVYLFRAVETPEGGS